MPRRDGSETPPHLRRFPSEQVHGKQEVTLTHNAASARDFIAAHLSEVPSDDFPATASGAVCAALEAHARRLGWKPKQ